MIFVIQNCSSLILQYLLIEKIIWFSANGISIYHVWNIYFHNVQILSVIQNLDITGFRY